MTSLAFSPLCLLPNTFRAFYGAFHKLHPIQERAIGPILQGKDLIIQSATGSGKTEAVLAPCLERVLTAASPISMLYIVPTRALAVDIFRRFDTVLNERLGLGLAIRTGDLKKKGGRSPALMLSTPESLDVMLGSSNQDISSFIARIDTVIIDEAHPLIHHYRGHHLVYLLQRLERRCNRRLRKIALSATLADPEDVRRFFGCASDTVFLVDTVSRQIVPRLVHLLDDDRELSALLDDLYRQWHYHKILIFANNRGRCDKIFSQLKRNGVFRHTALLHYSNLSARRRRDVERRFRKHRHAVCIATSTLELGIDVGDVDAVLLFEPPDSVAAFLQRLGRANRRKRSIHFWGICRGERAGEQALRFLALLHLARQGQVEKPLPKRLPSVLSQQIISCLYEKKRLSLAALKNLFCLDGNTELSLLLENIFTALVAKRWLRATGISAIYKGGWRYRDALLEHRIWSNFPETEQQYTLIVSGESVADIPLSIVRQFGVGDRVLLTGRRLRILWIDEGEDKRVLAEPTQARLDTEEILWAGTGCHVSLETAQAMRAILKSANPADHLAADGLFTRTRKLIEKQLETDKKALVLANSIEVVLTGGGLYQYRTYLGAVGNMILSQSIKDHFANLSQEVYLHYDEIGLTCSNWIEFEKLALPLDSDNFRSWIRQNFKTVRAMFPLNAFCTTLPPEILRRELTDFILDPRLIDFFQKYAGNSSEIVKGDPRNLALTSETATTPEPEFIDAAAAHQSLLIRAKARLTADFPDLCKKKTHYRLRPLTGTIMGDFFRHHQCRRRLCYLFLKPEDQPLAQGGGQDSFAARRMKRGLAFEAMVLDQLQGLDRNFHRISESGEHGDPRSFESRCAETCDWLNRVRGQKPSGRRIYLAQGVLMHKAVLAPANSIFEALWQKRDFVKGIGIPDLICAVPGKNRFRFQVGDIKRTNGPRYYQKWQIAFYAYLLNAVLQNGNDHLPIEAADTGFLLIPSPIDDRPCRHDFDLRPYLASIKAVFKNMEQCLSAPPQTAFWHLQRHCVNCSYFDACYFEALTKEEIQFIPGLREGELLKLRALGIKDISAAAAWLGGPGTQDKKEKNAFAQPGVLLASNGGIISPNRNGGDDLSAAVDGRCTPMVNLDLDPGQKDRLNASVQAILHDKIIFDGDKTQDFPANAGTFFFVHLLDDPVTMRPNALGLAITQGDKAPQIFTWVAASGSDPADVWAAFGRSFYTHWQESIAANGRPHIFLFGNNIRRQLYEWAAVMQDASICELFRQQVNADWTDLKQVLRRHFALPIPGRMTRFALAGVLGLNPGQTLQEPDSLWHADPFAERKSARQSSDELKACLTCILTFDRQLHQWITSHLQSDRLRKSWAPAGQQAQNMGQIYRRFLETEQNHQQRDIQDLQALSLAERVARFRALGPLNFTGTTLDQEGRFLYTFTLADSKNAGPSKFRRGDFSKLVAQGVSDLQSGIPVILAHYDSPNGQLSLYSRQKRSIPLNKRIAYSLEEDAQDWTTAKLIEVVQRIYEDETRHPVKELLCGRWNDTHPAKQQQWGDQWLAGEGKRAGLNAAQQTALKLPFQYALSLIQGPPGTGKTTLLGWILIALIRHAQASKTPLRIAVSALTHHAIDQVLSKVVALVNTCRLIDFPARCQKLGNWDGPEFDANSDAMQVEALSTSQQIALPAYLILGATGYALDTLMQKNAAALPDKPFDWIIFDEASQILGPYAMLSLVHGKGNYLFLGDIHQLPPVIRSSSTRQETAASAMDNSLSAESARLSMLEILMPLYLRQSAFLETTYRMNADICAFPSNTWYGGRLQPAPENAPARLSLTRPICKDDPLDMIIDPDKPVVLVRANHLGCGQESTLEANIMARIAHHLLGHHHLSKEQLALISPHRAQNNAITSRLSELLERSNDLPLIDTVERIQGAERDVIIFGFTSSDPDQVLGEFLNNPKRFNVAITRARKKLIVVCSSALMSAVAQNEQTLVANACFKAFFEHVREDANFVWQSRHT